MAHFSILGLLKLMTIAAMAVAVLQSTSPIVALTWCVPMTLVYFVLERMGSASRGTVWPLVCAVILGAVGAIVGKQSGFGLVVLRLRPDLPPQDFSDSFGAISGALVGAATGAVLGQIVSFIVSARSRKSAGFRCDK